MSCNIIDITCNFNAFISWLYSLISGYIDPILNLISSLLNLIGSIFSLLIGFFTSIFALGTSILNLLGFFYYIWSIDPIMMSIVALIGMYCGIVIFLRVWNIVADLEIVGNKLPHIKI